MPSQISLNVIPNKEVVFTNTVPANASIFASTVRDIIIDTRFGTLLSNNSIPSSKLQLIAPDKLSTESLSGGANGLSVTRLGQIAPYSINDFNLADNAIVTRNITNNSITPVKLSTGSPSWDSSGDVTVTRGLTSNRHSTFASNLYVLGQLLVSGTGDGVIVRNNIRVEGSILGNTIDNLNAQINTLRQDMQKIINTPYGRFVEVSGEDQPIVLEQSINSQFNDMWAQRMFPDGLTKTDSAYQGERAISINTTQFDSIGLFKFPDRGFSFPSTGVYAFNVRGADIRLQTANNNGSFDILVRNNAGQIVLTGTSNMVLQNKGDIATPTLEGRINVTNASTVYYLVFRGRWRDAAEPYVLLPRGGNGNATIFVTEISKLS